MVAEHSWHTVWACGQGVKGAVGVAGWAAELQSASWWALDSLSGAVTDRRFWQETRVVVVDKVAQDAAIRERHGEVLHLHTQAERDFIYCFQLVFWKLLTDPLHEG